MYQTQELDKLLGDSAEHGDCQLSYGELQHVAIDTRRTAGPSDAATEQLNRTRRELAKAPLGKGDAASDLNHPSEVTCRPTL